MKNKNPTDSLDDMILHLEKKNANDLLLLREQFNITYESIKPLNQIKKIFHEITTSPEIKKDVIDNVLSLGSGLLIKKIFVGGSHNFFRKTLGTIAEFSIANIVSKHSEEIKIIGNNLIQNFINPKQRLRK